MANMHNIHGIALDGEENPIYVRLVTVEKLSHFKGKPSSFRSKRATLG